MIKNPRFPEPPSALLRFMVKHIRADYPDPDVRWRMATVALSSVERNYGYGSWEARYFRAFHWRCYKASKWGKTVHTVLNGSPNAMLSVASQSGGTLSLFPEEQP
mgnify:CR=1 FL=1